MIQSFKFLFITLFILIISSNNSLSQELIFATDDTPGNPYIIGDGSKFSWDKPGIEIELYKLLEKQLKLKIIFKRLPWKRCLLILKHGTVDGIFPASFKSERMQIGVYPMKNGKVDPLRKTRDNAYYLYKLKKSPVEWDGKSLVHLDKVSRKEIGAPLGWSIVSVLKKQGVHVIEKKSPLQLFDMLQKGGLAGVACLETVADTYINNELIKYKEIVKGSHPLWEKPYYLMLSHQFVKKHPQLAEKIWDTIAEIKQSEAFKSIVAKY